MYPAPAPAPAFFFSEIELYGLFVIIILSKSHIIQNEKTIMRA